MSDEGSNAEGMCCFAKYASFLHTYIYAMGRLVTRKFGPTRISCLNKNMPLQQLFSLFCLTKVVPGSP